jgi:hypothetical protein
MSQASLEPDAATGRREGIARTLKEMPDETSTRAAAASVIRSLFSRRQTVRHMR